PIDGFVGRLHPFRFLHGCDPSYRALTLALMGLTPIEHASLRWTHWSAKTRSDPAWIGMTFTLQSFAAGIHDEDRRVSASSKVDDSAECNAACSAAPPSESSRLEFLVRGLSGDVSGYNELSIAS